MIKRAADLVAEANARVETLSVAKAKPLLGSDDVVFVDVRDGAELARNGKIPGAVHAPRAFLEFHADPASPSHKPELASGKRLVVYCGSGAAGTLEHMGVERVANLLGGFTAWQQEGGDVER
ncbi:MAG: Rhodanese domain protein [Geminicoccaceae bacterium]|nr:Rhodanese domain protein [Geminicoccaceae bacterium]